MDDTTPPSSDSPKSQKTDKKLAATDGRNAPSLKRNSSAAGLNGCPASSSKLSPAAASLASPQSVRKTNVKGCGKTVGFIGLGNMGCAMVKNLISQSHTVFLYNRSSEKVFMALITLISFVVSSIVVLVRTVCARAQS